MTRLVVTSDAESDTNDILEYLQREAGARVAIVSPYLLIYDFTRADDTLTLLRVLHGRRDITKELLHR
jgi:plasmid stabilization system protein ParE